jgi:hypothetical protein
MVRVKPRVKFAGLFSVLILLSTNSSVRAEGSLNLPFPCPTVNGQSVFENSNNKNTPLIAQAGTAAEVADIAAIESVVNKKQKNEPLITDSLWGNLILDMAYQRDAEIKKTMRQLNLVNLGTMGAISAIAAGTLAQGIITLATLNPPAPLHDSYLPGAIGIGMSGITLVTFAGRAALNHCLVKKIHNRQLIIKHQVETILAQFESSHGANDEAQTNLTALIGQRAANEWMQLWRSSNVLAELKQPNISLVPEQLHPINIQ